MGRRILIPPKTPLHAMIPVDSSRLRGRMLDRYRKILRDIEKARDRIQEFETSGRAEFAEWYRRQFFRNLNWLREANDKIHFHEQVLRAIAWESEYLGIPRRQSYLVVMERVARGEDPLSSEARAFIEKKAAEESAEERARMERHRTGQFTDEDAEDYRELFEAELLRRFGRAAFALEADVVEGLFEDYLSSLSQRRQEKAAEEDRSEDDEEERGTADAESLGFTEHDPNRLKRLYRELAFKLHPDRNPNVTSREKELWMEVVEAYELKDLSRMEVLHSLYEGSTEAGVEKISQLSTILRMIGEVTAELRALRTRIRDLGKDTVFLFWRDRKSPVKLRKLRDRIQIDIRAEEDSLQYALSRLERELRKFSHPKTKAPRPGKKRKGS